MISPILDLLTSKLVRVNGMSMAPALPDGAWTVVQRRAFRPPRKPQRFDIVRFEDPTKPGRWLLKRIVGLPEEEVALEGEVLLVNGEQVAEEYLDGSFFGEGRYEWWPGNDEYVLLGDNRLESTDSRRFGMVPLTAFTGKVTRRLR